MSIDLYDQRSTIRGKISDEKEKRRKSSAVQKVLSHQKEEVTASATGKPAASSKASSRSPFKPQPMVPEASSSGRVPAGAGSGARSCGSLDVGTFRYSRFSKLT